MQVLSIGRKKRIHAVAFSPSGWELAAPCGDGQLRVWDLRTGAVRQSVPIEETSCGSDIAYLDDDRLIFAGVQLRWWDIPANGWNVIRPFMRWNRQLRLSPDRRCLAEVDQTTSTEMGTSGLVLLDTADWKPLRPLQETAHTTGGIAFSPDGRLLATGHMIHTGHKQRSFAPLPGRYAVPAYDYLVHVHDFASGRLVKSLDGWGQGVTHLAFSHDGRFVVGTAGPRLRVWDLESDREVVVHKRGPKHFQGLAFTADRRYLASVSNDETVRIWSADSWQECKTFTWGIGKLLNIALSPDGCRAAAGSDRGQVVIWDVDD
jgi:WD40 repeat protein